MLTRLLALLALLIALPLALAVPGCKSKAKTPAGEKVSMPFTGNKYETNNRFFRGTGTGVSTNQSIARSKADLDAKSVEHADTSSPDQTYYVGSENRYDYFVIRSGTGGRSRLYRVSALERVVTNKFLVTKDEAEWRGYTATARKDGSADETPAAR